MQPIHFRKYLLRHVLGIVNGSDDPERYAENSFPMLLDNLPPAGLFGIGHTYFLGRKNLQRVYLIVVTAAQRITAKVE